MNPQQVVLSLVLATMVFSVAFELRIEDFRRVAQTPRAVVCGLIPQFVLLPVATWTATLALDLPANTEAAMILVASCPGGSLSNVVTHFGRGNTALSVSISAVASVMALVLTPLNFTWMIAARMFALDDSPVYEQPLTASFAARARQRGVSALEVLYDHLAEGDGSNLIYFPIFNDNDGTLGAVREMLTHPRALVGLSDAGAHVGTICDASMSTFLLTHWVREKGGDPDAGLSLEQAVHLLSARNARHLGLADRGVIAPGLRADLNLIDPARLAVGVLRIVRDLPAGGRRFLQKGQGYLGTWVAGHCVQRDGEVTHERPGRLVRMGQ